MASLIGAVVTVDRDLIGEIPLEDRDSYLGSTHFRLREGSTGTVEAIGVLRDEDVVRLRLSSGAVCIVKVDDLDDVSAEERDAIRHFTSSVVHKADNDGGGVDEESSSSEEDSDGGDPDFEGEDPDSEGEKPTSRKRAAVAGGDGLKKPRPVGLQKPRYANEFRALAPENPLRVAFEEAEAKKDAEGAVALKAAVSAIKKWDLYDTAPRSSKITYKQTVSEVEAWVEAGNSKAKAAEWIRRLMSKSEDRLMPSEVRKKTKGDPRRGA